MTFGEKIRQHREQHNLTQDELADAVDANQPLIHRIETGTTTKIDYRLIYSLAQTLGVDCEYLLNDKE